MSVNDPLADALSKILNAERAGKRQVEITRVSNLLLKVLDLLRDHHYIGDYEVKETTRGRIVTLNLIGRINKCGAIKPRFPVGLREFDRFEQRYLPAVGFGVIIITTPLGIMTLNDAREKHVGGKLLAYCY